LIFARDQIYPGKGQKRAKRAKPKILGPASVVWDQMSEIWPQRGQPSNPDSDEQYCELYNGNIA